jgi:type VII secretion-associated protein (TIGR03931 family)
VSGLRVAVDFGTSSTCIAVSVRGREPQVVAVDGSPLMSSAVYAGPEGTLFVGQEADRQAAIDPSRYEPHPKRRIDEPELLLGNTVIGVREVIRAVLTRAVSEARRVAGGATVEQLVLTHPADWGGIRTRVLRQAANGLANRIVLVPEPVAAAVFHAASFPPQHGATDRPLAVLDLGGGTVDVSVVRRTGPGYQVLATHGDPTFGGADIDQLLIDHIGSLVSTSDPDVWRALIEGRELPDRRRRRVIHQDVRGAKETLSRHNYTDVPLPPPFPDAHITRADLERLIDAPIRRAVDLTERTIREAGHTPAQLAGIFLVGGSSRIPMVARLIHQRCGVVPTTLDQPETVVARGALRAVNPEPDHTGVVPASSFPPRQPPRVGPATPAHGHPVPPPPPPPVPAGNRRMVWLLGGIAAVLAGAVALILVLTSGGGQTPSSTPQSAPSREIAQYEYRFTVPDGWIQTGGDPAKLKTEIKPSNATQGQDRIQVEEIRLAFDSDADRARAVDKLRSDYNDQPSGEFTDFDDQARYAGRLVVHYQQHSGSTTVDWYILFKAHTQVSVGCQFTDAGHDTVTPACDTVVGTMTITE